MNKSKLAEQGYVKAYIEAETLNDVTHYALYGDTDKKTHIYVQDGDLDWAEGVAKEYGIEVPKAK